MTNSNLGLTSHRLRDMASVRLKTHIFPTPLFNPKFENVLLELHPPNFVGREPRQMVNYLCNKLITQTETRETAGVHV